MSLIKKYKNIIFLLILLIGILSSTGLINFAQSIAKSITEFFDNNVGYSKLSSQSQKYQNSFLNTKKEKTAEELDKEIMNQTKYNKNTQRDIRFNDNKDLDKKAADDKFNLDFKELDKF